VVDMKPTEIVTPPVRISFPALFEPRAVARGKEEKKYQASLLLPPDIELKPFLDCIRAAMLDKFGKLLKLPSRSNPIKDCGEKDLAGYEDGWHFINVKTQFQPAVLDQRKQEILDADRVFAGCWCRFHLNAYAWDHPVGGKGVSFSLNAVQLVREDARLDGRRPAVDVFDAIEVEEDVAFEDQDTADDAAELFG